MKSLFQGLFESGFVSFGGISLGTGLRAAARKHRMHLYNHCELWA